MSSTVIYKQSFKPRASPSSAGLNVRHLQYIATRPGAVYNPGCGFGLWGQLPGDGGIRIQNDLELAKKAVREASADHTLYRAILSVGKEVAQNFGLYDRGNWERLVNDHIHAVVREMDIKPENLCWCASMHYAKHHPHVHILFWDNGDQPRPDFINREVFDQKTERIRAEFAGDIHREDIRELQQEQREQLKELRAAIQAMCREANPEKALDLPRLYKTGLLDGLARQLGELLRDLPARGSLRYAYLPAQYKARVDKLIDSCLKVPELAKELNRYELYTRQISELYANGKTGTADNLEKARYKLRKELGNEVMGAIRAMGEEVQAAYPQDRPAVQAFAREIVSELVPALESYRDLQKLLPVERVPVNCMERQIPGYRDKLNHVIGDVLRDARVRLRLQAYALEAAGIDLDSKADAPGKKTSAQEAAGGKKSRVLFGKLLSDGEWDAYQKLYLEAKRDLRAAITEQVRLDAGWTDEALQTGAAMLMCDLMRLVSRAAYQRQAGAVQARSNLKTRSKDMSREARKDYWATQSHASEWGDGYN